MSRGRLVVSDIVVVLGRLALWAAAVVTAFQGQMLLEDRRNLGRALVYMAVATVFIAAATWRQRFEQGADHRDPNQRSALRQRLRAAAVPLALVAVALALGIAFRVYRLPTEPYGIWFDEAQNGIIADRMLHDSDYRPVFITGYTGTDRPALPVYVFAAGVKLLGREILALRSVSTLAGVLTLVPLFFLARELFGVRIAALATFFLAVMRWHLNFSRLAMEPIWAPFFAAAAIFFLVRGVRRGRWYDFAASGLLLGLGLQFYWAFLLVPLLYAFYTAHSFLARQSTRLAPLAVGAFLVAVVGFVAYSPVAVYGLQHPDQYTQRSKTVTITKDKDLGETIEAVKRTTRLHVLMFNSSGDRNGRHNLPGEPELDAFTGIFFVLGLGISLSRLWQPRYLLLVAWVVVLLQPAIWSLEFEAPQSLRAILVTPAVAILAALPLGALWALAAGQRDGPPENEHGGRPEQVFRRLTRRLRREPVPHLVMVAVALAVLFFLAQTAYRNYDTYFNRQLTNPVVWQYYSTDATVVAKEIDRLGPDYDYWLSTLFLGQPTLEFVNPQLTGSGTLGFDWVRDVPARSDGPAAFFLDGTKQPFFDWLKDLYPEGTFRSFAPPGSTTPVLVYEAAIPAEDVKALRGLEAVCTPAEGEPTRHREVALDLDWSSSGLGALPVECVWSGFIKIPEYREYALTLEAPGQVRLLMDGELLGEGVGSVETVRRLYRGEHALRVEARVEGPGRIRLSWDGSPVPPEAYFAYPEAGHGLLGSFYASDNWEGEPQLVELTPLVGFRYHAELNMPAPFTVRWEGYLEAPVSGAHNFRLETIDDGWLAIDGQEVLSTPRPNSGEEADKTLTAGRHAIEVRFRNRAGFPNIYLYWTPPNGQREIIPPARLSPR